MKNTKRAERRLWRETRNKRQLALAEKIITANHIFYVNHEPSVRKNLAIPNEDAAIRKRHVRNEGKNYDAQYGWMHRCWDCLGKGCYWCLGDYHQSSHRTSEALDNDLLDWQRYGSESWEEEYDFFPYDENEFDDYDSLDFTSFFSNDKLENRIKF